MGWSWENSGGKTHEVGMKIGNELGIYDLSGNAWEWCFDAWSMGKNRVFRGGSWLSNAGYARVSNRSNDYPSISGYSIGFRVARS